MDKKMKRIKELSEELLGLLLLERHNKCHLADGGDPNKLNLAKLELTLSILNATKPD